MTLAEYFAALEESVTSSREQLELAVANQELALAELAALCKQPEPEPTDAVDQDD